MLLRAVRTPQRTVTFARSLRASGNAAEKKLWKRLQNRKVMGMKFRRQVPVGPYIADFFCAETRLILEIDGDSHYECGAQEHDRRRDAFLLEKGFTVLRLSNRKVLEDIDGIVEHIVSVLEESGSPSPSLAAARFTLSRGERE